MMILIGTAAAIGFMHSIAPAHWLPLVLLSKTKKWGILKTLTASVVAASGHILVSIVVTVAVVKFGVRVSPDFEELIELNTGRFFLGFGILYASYHAWQHWRCRGHLHHGPNPQDSGKRPFAFLFTIGLSPCVAVLPALIAIEPYGPAALTLGAIAFSLGVVAALSLASVIVRAGTFKLDHPWLEHYDDVILGVGLAGVGVIWMISG